MKVAIGHGEGITVYATKFGFHAEGKNGQLLVAKFSKEALNKPKVALYMIGEGIIFDIVNDSHKEFYDVHYKKVV